MASVYTSRFMLAELSAGGTQQVSVPTGFRWVLKDVEFVVDGNDAIVRIEVAGNPVIGNSTTGYVSGGFGSYSWQGWIVAMPGETVQAYSSIAGSVVISGFQFADS